jgi:RNase P protein component
VGDNVGKRGTAKTADYTLFYGEKNEINNSGMGFFVHKKKVSAFKRVEFTLRGCHM